MSAAVLDRKANFLHNKFMEFRWNDWNIEHIGKHGVQPDEAELLIGSIEAHSRERSMTTSGWFGERVEGADSSKPYSCWTRMRRYT